MKNIIYGLYCPLTNKPVYIGKSTVGIKRPFKHITEKSHSIKVNEWVKSLHDINKEPILVILENDVDEKYINEKELFWINYTINNGNILLNQTGIKATYFDVQPYNNTDETDYMSDIRNYVKIRRKELKLTQLELSQKSGLGIRFIRDLEQSKKTNFNTDSLIKVVRFLGRGTLGIVLP